MALTYDLENDIRYKQGQEKKAISAIKNMLSANLSKKQIADFLEVPLEFVQKIADSLKN
jgi:DNA-directed RNA polymerase specialized sigma subunit